MTDDQDQMLGSSFPQHNNVGPMPQTKALLQDKGAMALNFFIHTPICCPSRSELLTGMYFHNIKSYVRWRGLWRRPADLGLWL